jgi:hypothetical protein
MACDQTWFQVTFIHTSFVTVFKIKNMNFKFLNNLTGWLVFAIAFVVMYFSIEDTGSLWDCGEFILGADKLQVVHPPGAPLFLLIGRVAVMIGSLFSSAPESAALSVNMLSGICTAATGMFICWTTVILSKMALVGREEDMTMPQMITSLGSGLVAGLATVFCSSIWFSAVEGEVYAMSTFFTGLTIWAVVKWYHLPESPQSDRWLFFAVYATALSIGVHLLSLLTFPALTLFYYFKKYKNQSFGGMILAAFAGLMLVIAMQVFIVTGLPKLWAGLELLCVNSFGLPVGSGLVPLVAIVVGVLFVGLSWAEKHQNALAQKILVGLALSVIGFSTIGMVLIRANANTPVNMNAPTDPIRLLPYLNREQYGDRPLFSGPNFSAKPADVTREPRYGLVGDKYKVVDEKIDYVFRPQDKVIFPRMGDYQPGRDQQYKNWLDNKNKYPGFVDNFSYFWNYQMGWMYWRYFGWNFIGRQNGEQGYFPWDKSKGQWMSGITALDEFRLHNMSALPTTMKEHQATNKYYFLPLIFGLFGFIYQLIKRNNEWWALLGLFIITGIGIVIFTNQTPMEPRERDYVHVGSFMTFCIWIGLGVTAMFDFLRQLMSSNIVAPLSVALALSAPIVMGTQNFDDHSRRNHTGSRDYASNFLNSCDKDAIIFTYGDNDTYPLWYAQEVENIRTDVRVVNLSLIAVDWYIDQLRRKVNNSEAIKMTIPSEAYRGSKRNQLPINPMPGNPEMDLRQVMKFVGEDHPLDSGRGDSYESYFPTSQFSLTVDVAKCKANGTVMPNDTGVVSTIKFNLGKRDGMTKDDIAVLDIIASNFGERPIYFAVTCREDKTEGLDNYMQLEGLALKLVPISTPSDPQFGIIGNGRVNDEKIYANVMEKFRWGNFDKMKMFVDRSYGPSVQSHALMFLRGSRNLIRSGNKEKAIQMIDKYFEAFPAYNFPYDQFSMYMAQSYLEAGANDKAKDIMKKIAAETAEFLRFYDSLTAKELNSGFQNDAMSYLRIKMDLIRSAREVLKDEAFAKELEDQLNQYKPELKLDKPQPRQQPQ